MPDSLKILRPHSCQIKEVVGNFYDTILFLKYYVHKIFHRLQFEQMSWIKSQWNKTAFNTLKKWLISSNNSWSYGNR